MLPHNVPEIDVTALLKQTCDSIANEDNAFSMEQIDWGEYTVPPEDSFKGKCGTPACILGWSYHHYLKNNGFTHPDLSKDFLFDYCEMLATAFIEEFNITYKGLTEPKVNGSLNTYSYYSTPKWFTRKRTIATLDKFLETGSIDWLALEEKEDA